MTVAPMTNAVPPADSGAVQPRNLKEAASQFEALLISQMLKSVHESGEAGWLGTGDDQAGASMGELAEEHFAQALAAQGGMGVAKMVVKNLDKPKPAAADVQGGLENGLRRVGFSPRGASAPLPSPAVAAAGLKPTAAR